MKKTHVEQQIKDAVGLYADFHGVPVDSVDVTREFEGDTVTRFRLSLDSEGHSRGCDEWHEVTR